MATLALRLAAALVALVAAAPSWAADSLPDAWASSDIGAVGATGSASLNAGAFTVRGAGADVWNSADAFRFLYVPLAGDGSVITRVTAVDNVNAWTKAGVMMRETLAANSRHAFMLVSPGKGLAFQRRASTGGMSVHTSGGSGTAPSWVKLERAGDQFTASRSNDGITWTVVGSHTIAMGSTIYAGVAVSSHVYGTTAGAAFEWTQVSSGAFSLQGASSSLPAAFLTRDIGSVGREGAAGGSRGQFSLDGAGADVWGSSDAFRFTYTPLTGNGSIVTRVVAESSENVWVKAGVMMRESLAANSRHAFMLVSPGKGLAFQRRTASGGQSTHTSGGSGTAPYWVKLVRDGSTITAYRSLDGQNWSQVGSDTIAMASTIYVGVALSSHVYGVTARATFDGTAITRGAGWQPEPAPEPEPEPAPLPQPPSGGGSTLRLLHWNTHHGGIRTDGVYDPNGIATWIAQFNPDIVSLNEVDNASQINAIVSRLEAVTGRDWNTVAAGVGNVLLTKLPLDTSSSCTYNASYPRIAPHLSVTVGGRRLNVFSSHLDVSSATTRLSEVKNLQGCASAWTEARIIAGDYNMQAGSTEYNQAVVGYQDAWKVAKSLGTALNYSGNCDGCTRNSRIDYVFTSSGATMLSLKSAEIFDTRDSSGVSASDHKPMLVIYQVN